MKLKSENRYKILKDQSDSEAKEESELETMQYQKERLVPRSSNLSMKKEGNVNEMSVEDVRKAIEEFMNEQGKESNAHQKRKLTNHITLKMQKLQSSIKYYVTKMRR